MIEFPWATQELEDVRQSARKFYERELGPNEERWSEQQHVDRDVWLKAGAAGLLCAGISEAYGGAGGDFRHEALLFYEQSYAVAPGLGNGVHSGIVAHYLENFASEAQKLHYLPKMASGEMIGAIAMSEPGAGSDLQAIRARAIRDGDHYVVDGSKTWISNGMMADLVLLVVKTDPTKGAAGMSILIVEPAKAPGFKRGRAIKKIGQHSQDTAELFFEDMVVPVENLLGPEEGQGFKQLMRELPRERVIAAMGSQGSMDRAIAETVPYTMNRKMFGDTLFGMQNTRFKLAECQTKATISRAFINNCVALLAEGKLDTATAAMAKYWCTQTCGEIVDECLQLHGGYGYTMEYAIGRIYQNTRISRILAGSNEVMKELIARDIKTKFS